MSLCESVIESFPANYAREYGDRKLRKVASKVESSLGVEKYLSKLNNSNSIPHFNNIITTVMNMPYFMVAKKETVAVASIILLKMWNEKENSKSNLLTDYGLEEMV